MVIARWTNLFLVKFGQTVIEKGEIAFRHLFVEMEMMLLFYQVILFNELFPYVLNFSVTEKTLMKKEPNKKKQQQFLVDMVPSMKIMQIHKRGELLFAHWVRPDFYLVGWFLPCRFNLMNIVTATPKAWFLHLNLRRSQLMVPPMTMVVMN